MTKIVYNKVLRGWYVVRGPHQTPLSGWFESKAAAQLWLDDRVAARRSIAGGRWRSGAHSSRRRPGEYDRVADRIDGYDHDDLGLSPDF